MLEESNENQRKMPNTVFGTLLVLNKGESSFSTKYIKPSEVRIHLSNPHNDDTVLGTSHTLHKYLLSAQIDESAMSC